MVTINIITSNMSYDFKPPIYYYNFSADEAKKLGLKTSLKKEGTFYSRSTKIQTAAKEYLEVREARRYSKGQIYKIISSNTEKIYIGSTILPLDVRFSSHKSHKNCSSMHIINEGNASIQPMYEYPCKNKPELEAEEGRRVMAFRNDGLEVVNKYTPGAIAAAGGIKEYDKEYYKANREKALEKMKEYYKANREKALEYKKEYDKANKEKTSEYYKNIPRYQCECCNKEFKKYHLKIHKTSKKYINNMKQINDISN